MPTFTTKVTEPKALGLKVSFAALIFQLLVLAGSILSIVLLTEVRRATSLIVVLALHAVTSAITILAIVISLELFLKIAGAMNLLLIVGSTITGFILGNAFYALVFSRIVTKVQYYWVLVAYFVLSMFPMSLLVQYWRYLEQTHKNTPMHSSFKEQMRKSFHRKSIGVVKTPRVLGVPVSLILVLYSMVSVALGFYGVWSRAFADEFGYILFGESVATILLAFIVFSALYKESALGLRISFFLLLVVTAGLVGLCLYFRKSVMQNYNLFLNQRQYGGFLNGIVILVLDVLILPFLAYYTTSQ